MAALTPEERKTMADIMSQYKPAGSIYDQDIQTNDFWRKTSPSKLAVGVYYELRNRKKFTDKSNYGQNEYVYVDYEYPRTNVVLSLMDSTNTNWENLNWLYPMRNQPGDQHDKNLFNRRLYEVMTGTAQPLQTIPTVKVPKGQTDIITNQRIQDGMRMIDFLDERDKWHRYYTEETYDSLETPKRNPFTRELIEVDGKPPPQLYIAEIDPEKPFVAAGGRRRKTRKTKRRHRKTRRARSV
jgi:hypothetical protein